MKKVLQAVVAILLLGSAVWAVGCKKEKTMVVETFQVTNITNYTATMGGKVSFDDSSSVVARGVCWSKNPNPEVNMNHHASGAGTGSFSCNVIDLEPATTYYVRAYAINSAGICYGSQVSFMTLTSGGGNGGDIGGGNSNVPEGAADGVFSVSSSQKVYISIGNLQYQASTSTWRFAEHPWDYVGNSANGNVDGSDNELISAHYSGWIDLFGWGTSGYDCGNVCYQPYYSSQVDVNYGPWGNYDLTGSYANCDWGVYNKISNGGNVARKWRTPTYPEWNYIFFNRQTPSNIRFVKARVNGVNGMIILPDDWETSVYTFSKPNDGTSSYASNTITETIWKTKLQINGAVFLPAAGERMGTSVSSSNTWGRYWTSSSYDAKDARYFYFFSSTFETQYRWSRFRGHSVRLVRNVE